MNGRWRLAALAVLLAAAPLFGRQAPDGRAAFVQALGEFSLALDGTVGDEGARIRAILALMERALAAWDETIRRYEAGMAAERAGAAAPLAARMHLALAGAYLDRGRVADALAELTSARTLDPSRADVHTLIGLARSHLGGDRDGAIDALRTASALERIAIHPNDPDAHHDLGDIYLRQGRHEEALAAFTAAVMLNPRLAEAHAALAQTYLREGLHADAIDSAGRAIAIDRAHEQARYTLAMALVRSGRADEGKKELAVFQQLQAESAAMRSRLFEVEGLKREAALATTAGDHEKAVALLRRVFVLQPAAASSHLELGLAHLRAGQYADAVDRLSSAVVLDPAPDTHRRLAEAYAALGRHEESQRELAAYERLRRDLLRRRSAGR